LLQLLTPTLPTLCLLLLLLLLLLLCQQMLWHLPW
jgi:hypothetical protein